VEPGPGPDQRSNESARAFILALGQALHAHGYAAHRLEESLYQLSRRLGLSGQFFSTPTAIFASFGDGDEQRTYHLRIEGESVDLGRLTRLDALRGAVAGGERTPGEGLLEVEAIIRSPPAYPTWLTTACFGFASAAAARFFGGGAREVAAAVAIGLVIGLLARLTVRAPALGRVFEPVAAFVATFLAGAAAAFAGPVSPYVATLAGLIVLIPGFPLTVAMTELAMRHLVSGTARLAGAAITFFAIAFGAAAGGMVSIRVFGPAPLATPVPLPDWALPMALVLAPLAFAVLLRAEARDAPAIVAAGVLGFAGARGGALVLGPGLGAFAGAFLVTLFGNVWNRWTSRPAVVPAVPGILLLVPGSLGFKSLSALVGRDTVGGIETAFEMVLVAVSLAMGLIFAGALLPPRSLSPEPRAASR
jgi:uncharacterized membrane protein YjjP (DUF1212 family)